MGNFTYYIALLVIIIIGFWLIKKVASCLVKSIIAIVLVAVAVALYYFYLR
jgi:multisubunit Na+/H+ antiporter MnhC subunit